MVIEIHEKAIANKMVGLSKRKNTDIFGDNTIDKIIIF
jgi:hypothetical protein